MDWCKECMNKSFTTCPYCVSGLDSTVKPSNFKIYEKESIPPSTGSSVTGITATKDNINPSHYRNGKVECIDALESATIGKNGIEAVCVANVIKYLWRYEDKNGIEDIKKAKWYLERLISVMDKE